jgi:transposase-like protein
MPYSHVLGDLNLPLFVDTLDRTKVRQECVLAKRKRRAFTKEFKVETVQLVRDSGTSVGAAVWSWISRRHAAAVGTTGRGRCARGRAVALTAEEREELARLRCEVSDVADGSATS